MSNDYYNGGAFPSTGSAATSASMRAELSSVTTGFDKLPALTGNAYKAIMVNSAGTALAATSTLTGIALTGGTVENSAIGTLTPNTGNFTSLAATSLLVGGSSVVTASSTVTLTNKTISGASNTLTNIANASLTNSSVTIGSTSVALGATATTLAGLTSVTATSFVGTLSGNATNVTGTVLVANGGTGSTTASGARTNLLPTYAGNGGKVLAVNAGATDVEYISVAGAGTVTSVNASGGTTGMSFSGGPITASGTLTLAGTLAVANGGTGSTTASGARSALSAAASGANSDITSLSGLTTALSVVQGGTGGTTAAGARTNLLPAYAGNGGKVLAVNTGATDVEWIAVAGAGTVTSVNASGGTTGLTFSGGPITASGTLTLAGTLAVANGGTGSTTASGARSALSAAASGANGDITSLSGLTTALSVGQGGTGSTSSSGARTNLGVAIGSDVQAYNADLTAIAALAASTGLVKKTGAATYALDTNTYLTTNQNLSISGDASGSGATAISLTLANSGVTAGTYTKLTVDAKGRATVGASLASADVTTALGYTPYNGSTNPNSYATLAGSETLSNKTLGATTLGGNLTGGDFTVTRSMLKDTGYVFYDSGTTSALDYVNGSQQRWAPSGTVTLSVANWAPNGNLSELLIEGVNLGAATITWPTVNWIKSDGTTTTTFSSNGVTLQSSGTDWVLLWTRNGGTTVYGKVVR